MPRAGRLLCVRLDHAEVLEHGVGGVDQLTLVEHRRVVGKSVDAGELLLDFGDPVVVLLLDLGGLVLKPGGFGDTVEDRLPRRAVGGPVVDEGRGDFLELGPLCVICVNTAEDDEVWVVGRDRFGVGGAVGGQGGVFRPVDLSLQSRHALVATLDLEHGDRPKTEGEHRVDAGLVQHDDPLRLLLDGR